ncbi:MAG: hypothetical protein IKP77_04365 [Acholeplasmatales bacterium]|nr:hypothetical protein [Acholeplasmatales bacterium]
MADEILEPLESYNKIYKEQFNDNAKSYFEELVETSKIDVEANRKTIKELKAKQEEYKKKKRKKRWLNFFKILLIILSVIFVLVAIFITTNSNNNTLKVWIWIGAGLFIAMTILLIVFVLIPKTLKLQSELDILKKEIEELTELSWRQMAPLNALYDWGIPALLIERTIPLFQMDKHFDNKKYYYMNKKYGLDAGVDNNASTYYVQSGSILGNPFLLCKDFRMDMRMKTYEGSIVIHWTTRVHTKNGTQTVHHTQTLRAYVRHEAPYYQYVTYLIYGNDAAPKLTFSRMPSKGSDLEGKDLKKFVKKGAHKLDEKQRKEMMDNDPNTNYARFGNDEFEVLFGGTDRNNELEYRLLFTPLAQKNMLHLLKDGPYGDDFSMVKEHALNYIQSIHSQSFNYNANPTLFISNDHDAAKEFFIDYNNKYFKNFFFEIAPLMSIPIYQQHKSIEYIYGEDIDANLSTYEHEAMANRFNPNDLKHPKAATPNIYKTTYISKNNKTDRVLITANSFRAERRVTYVTKMGGDGRMHTIPVYWIEYIPVFKETEMSVEESEISRPNFNSGYADKIRSIIEGLKAGRGDYRFERGLLATIIAGDMIVGNNISDVLNTTSKVEEVFDIEKTVRELEKELDEMDKNSQKEGVGVDDINTLSEKDQKEVSESDVDISIDKENDVEESDK